MQALQTHIHDPSNIALRTTSAYNDYGHELDSLLPYPEEAVLSLMATEENILLFKRYRTHKRETILQAIVNNNIGNAQKLIPLVCKVMKEEIHSIIRKKDVNGNTILHTLAEQDSDMEVIAMTLLDAVIGYGQDRSEDTIELDRLAALVLLDVENNEGKIALDIAKERGKEKLVRVLEYFY